MTLKKMREDLGYSQLAVESITGVPQSTISRIERSAKHKPREALMEYAIMQKLADYEAQKKNGKDTVSR